ncbi:uncharacterized protein LOC134775279 isoform X2 [Penaeus indicus]|uniref:uncharacterized protein LOC134775279 isoform X2 n=1 Tax=Penaeus indicus TaxID=29960 RepID=UPI00300D1853
MVGSYTSLPPGVAATVPRRILLRDSWVKHAAGPPEEAAAEATEPSTTEPTSSPPPFTSPSTRPSLFAREGPRSPPLASPPCLSPDLPRPFERFRSASTRESRTARRPASVVLTTYISTAAKDEFQGLSGKVSRTKAFFESSPLQVKGSSGEGEEADRQEPDLPPDTLVTYTFRNPLRTSPKPRPLRRYRNTLSSFPRWADLADASAGGDNDISAPPRKPGYDSAPEGEARAPEEVTIKRVRPVVSRRRHGTIVGILKNPLSPPAGDTAQAVASEEREIAGGGAKGGPGGGASGVGGEARAEAGGGGGGGGGPGRPAPASGLSSDRDAERSRHAAPCSPLPSCRCDHATLVPGARASECHETSAAAGHEPVGDDMVVPGDAGVQAAPRVVAACIKSYHDIPEELFNSLQESSVDPSPSPPPPAKQDPSPVAALPPPAPPTPAPRSDWKTMRDGRRALLAGGDEASDVDTEEGSELDGGGGAASTSDYHTSDGRGSSLSGASDDHHKHDSAQRHADDHLIYATNGSSYITQGDEVDYECFPGGVSAPTALIRDNFRGFCSTMLGSSLSPPPGVPPPRPPPHSPPRSASPEYEAVRAKPPASPSRLEEELRAAGVYFRRPGSSPPRLARLRSHTPARGSVGEAEAAALHALDASLAGQSGSSGESSPAQCDAARARARTPPSAAPARLSRHVSSLPPAHPSGVPRGGQSPGQHDAEPRPPAARAVLRSPAVPGADAAKGGVSGGDPRPERPPVHAKPNVGVGGARTVVTLSGEDGPPARAESAMENLNLIEEVYVDTRPAPASSVFMRAYYPGVHYTPTGSSKTSAKPPPPARRSSLNPAPSRRAALEEGSSLAPGDSDSGHESGATSPCGTLTGDDTQSPPPSPPHAHAHKGHVPPAHLHDLSSSGLANHSRSPSLQSCRGAAVLEGEVGVAVVGEPRDMNGMGALEARPPTHFVVVAIDFGTTYSGYAFSFTRDPENVHMMKKWEGGDPGVQNQKTPTIVLLTPDGRFHSLGFTARDTYHDLDPKEAKRWLYFDRFKMALHADQTLSRDTMLEAANGRKVPALQIFSHALRYFRDHALRELSDQAGVTVLEEDVRWVITVPAIWSHPAKQFMRTAAYQAGMGSSARPEQLLIALEPEAAAIYCRRLRRHQLLPDRPPDLRQPRHSSTSPPSLSPLQESGSPIPVPAMPELDRDTVYAVVDCGGGTVDITVHQMTDRLTGHLKELHKASGGPYGSTGVDVEFERLLETLFGSDFLSAFRRQRPAAFVDLMIAFESRKRNASPFRENPLNIALPFSFIDLFRKFRGKDVEWAIKKHQHLGVRWSAQGMLRVEQETMRQLFLPTLANITQAIESVLSAPEVGPLQYMFLVGGFAESELLQKHIRDVFGHRVNVIIPQGMGLAILRGAVQFGLDPGVVTVRRSRLTYGVGVLNRFQHGMHPPDKRVVAAGAEWCADVLDRFVAVDESVAVGDVVVRSYTPATPAQSTVILHLYATERHDAKFVTEDGVRRVGTLHLDLGSPPPLPPPSPSPGTEEDSLPQRREITVHMKFGDTEVKASAVDHLTGQCVRANIDFLTL